MAEKFQLHANGWAQIDGTSFRTMGSQTVANEHSPVTAVGGYPIHSSDVLNWPNLEANSTPPLAAKDQPEKISDEARLKQYIDNDMCG